jgi:hypothetical protein
MGGRGSFFRAFHFCFRDRKLSLGALEILSWRNPLIV